MASIITDMQYIAMVGVRLKLFKKTGNRTFMFRCPLCGDSKRDDRKTRGFFYEKDNRMHFKCHNCGEAHYFSTFLKRFDDSLYKEYRFDGIVGSRRQNKQQVATVAVKNKGFGDLLKRSESNKFMELTTPIMDLSDDHPAKVYILSRGIPDDMVRCYISFTEQFKTFANTMRPMAFEEPIRKDYPRIVIAFKNKERLVDVVQGRKMPKSQSPAKYITIKVNEAVPKIFGLDRLNPSKRVYVVEGPIDAMFVDNCLGAAGSDLVQQVLRLGLKDVVFVYDNEPRSPETTKKIQATIKLKQKVVIFDRTVKQKDLNEMALAGVNVAETLRRCTFQGITATVKFNKWRRVK